MDPRSLNEGQPAFSGGENYRLVTQSEREISKPKWLDYLRIALLLLLTVAVVVLPFVPFYIRSLRRKKAQAAREPFYSPDAAEAIGAIFRHVAAYLEATDLAAENKPFREWEERLSAFMPENYCRQWTESVPVFEEAVYSDHCMTEDQREQMQALLSETERLLYDEADWKRRFRLSIVECLHE